MAFRGLTKKGTDYLATRLANELAVEFLKVEIGDGAVVSGQNPKNQTSLISYKKDVRILKKEQENNAINLTIQITNDDITQGFYLKEIGIYVNDSTSNGCLYWYCNEDNAQYIPAKTDSVIAFEIDIRMEVTNSDATIINWSGKNTWINKEYLEENYTQNGGYKGTAQEIDDRVVSALGKEDGKFPLNEAIQGNVYYFPANKKFYICKESQNRRVSVPDGNFEELSIWENRKRLENLFKINNLKYDSGNIKILINQQWQNIGIIDISDKYINIVVFNFLGDKSLNYTFHIDNLKFERGYYFLINSTPGFGYSGAYIRIIDNNIQLKSTGDSSHNFYLRSLQIYN
ncbi:phage tail protein [Fusobacterium polymorphum]|uniref:phage tail-collar fiber domain-containing protein n=1 Tax=Fusobacterium nucleatum subsp. polymorphum TaxID=76857 RepID=UPI0030D219C2